MKSDLDRLMRERDMVAFIIGGGEEESPERNYMTHGAHIMGGLILKKVGETGVAVVSPMEIEEMKDSGLECFTFNDVGLAEIALKSGGDPLKTQLDFWKRCLDQFAVPPGRVGIYGVGMLGHYLTFFRALEKELPQYELVGEIRKTLFTEAMATKSPQELERIRVVAQKTAEVMQMAWDYLSSMAEKDGAVVDGDGRNVTIGDVKALINRALLDRGLVDQEGMIFAQGRDAAFPHSRGEADTPLRTGQTIVFDFFPREIGGGYFHDCTRTWSIGYATEEVQRSFQDVSDAFDVAVETFVSGGKAHRLQDAVLDLFESRGHPTGRSHPGTTDGYTHGLGHGVGLRVHEAPGMSHLQKEDILQPGNVITIEPGVYYPDRGYGIRLEDTFYVSEQGELISLSPHPKDLVLPLKGGTA
ncbi:MAG: M24 family metallopeptidase [Anaerolineaceae bacterium]|nr:M24 family metallopeptidase [Anaerolineaceae bacterium]